MTGVFTHYFPSYFWRHSLSPNLEFMDLASLAGQLCSGDPPVSVSPELAFYVCIQALNLSVHICMTSSLFTKPSPQLLVLVGLNVFCKQSGEDFLTSASLFTRSTEF